MFVIADYHLLSTCSWIRSRYHIFRVPRSPITSFLNLVVSKPHVPTVNSANEHTPALYSFLFQTLVATWFLTFLGRIPTGANLWGFHDDILYTCASEWGFVAWVTVTSRTSHTFREFPAFLASPHLDCQLLYNAVSSCHRFISNSPVRPLKRL